MMLETKTRNTPSTRIIRTSVSTKDQRPVKRNAMSLVIPYKLESKTQS